MIIRLKVFFNPFYQANKNKLRIASLGFFVPLLFQVTFNYVRILSPDVRRYSNDNDYLSIAYDIIAIYIPTLFQMSTLIFGIIRKSEDTLEKNKESVWTDVIDENT
jgi:hypothetical protein